MANEQVFHLGIKGLIRNPERKILLLKINQAILKPDNYGEYWDIPGGRIQDGYSIEETLHREIEEETGITDISDISFLTSVVANIRIPVDDEGSEVGLVLYLYSVSTDTKDSEITLSEEHTEFGWFEPAEAAKRLSVKYPERLTALITS